MTKPKRKSLAQVAGLALAGAELGTRSPEPKPRSAVEQHEDGGYAEREQAAAAKLDVAAQAFDPARNEAFRVGSMQTARELQRKGKSHKIDYEVEITPEMLAEGLRAYEWGFGSFDETMLVQAIYTAMARVA